MHAIRLAQLGSFLGAAGRSRFVKRACPCLHAESRFLRTVTNPWSFPSRAGVLLLGGFEGIAEKPKKLYSRKGEFESCTKGAVAGAEPPSIVCGARQKSMVAT